jgi:Bacterial transcriptional activator domain
LSVGECGCFLQSRAGRATRGQPGGGAPGQPSRKRVDVQVLGTTPKLSNAPPHAATPPPWRPQARELLAYLICHPRGVAEHLLFEDVLGDVPGSKVRSRLNTYVYNLHQQLRATGGPGTYITHTPRGHVMIDPDRVDSDLWRLHHHLHNAAAATDTDHRITELRAAVAAYTGPLAADHDYFWIPPIPEATRRQAIDAHLTLADLLTGTDPAAAIIVIEQAISHDPCNETLYPKPCGCTPGVVSSPPWPPCATGSPANSPTSAPLPPRTRFDSPTTSSPTRRHTPAKTATEIPRHPTNQRLRVWP